MIQSTLSLNSLVLLCLCADFFDHQEAPLTSKQYQRLEFKLAHCSLKQPSGLLNSETSEMMIQLALDQEEVKQIQNRLATLPLVVKKLAYYEMHGIGVITKYEEDYPEAFLHCLKKDAPLMLFYSGQLHLLKEKMISIAGPVHAHETTIENGRAVADKIYREHYCLMTSGHAGCEMNCLIHFLKQGGKAVLFTADGLLKKSIEFKKIIRSGQLLLISHREPQAAYEIVESLVRNSYIYALCRTNFIIHSELNTGSLYFSALQNLKNRWSKLLAIVDDEFYGNAKLVEAGAIPVTMERILSQTTITALLEVSKQEMENMNPMRQLSIFDFMEGENDDE